MVTFCIIAFTLVLLILIAVGGIAVLGTVLSGVALIVLDVIIGISPFVGLFLLIRWLLKKRS